MFTLCRNRCSSIVGITVRHQSESLFTLCRNRCSASAGICAIQAFTAQSQFQPGSKQRVQTANLVEGLAAPVAIVGAVTGKDPIAGTHLSTGERVRAWIAIALGAIGLAEDYRAAYKAANPAVNIADIVVHHSVPQRVLTVYPGRFTTSELDQPWNLRGVSRGTNGINSWLHLSAIAKEWNGFYKANANASRQQILDFAQEIDNKFGGNFIPFH